MVYIQIVFVMFLFIHQHFWIISWCLIQTGFWLKFFIFLLKSSGVFFQHTASWLGRCIIRKRFSANVESRIIHELSRFNGLDGAICFLRNCRMWNGLILLCSMNNSYRHSSDNIIPLRRMPCSICWRLLSYLFSGLQTRKPYISYFAPIQIWQLIHAVS